MTTPGSTTARRVAGSTLRMRFRRVSAISTALLSASAPPLRAGAGTARDERCLRGMELLHHRDELVARAGEHHDARDRTRGWGGHPWYRWRARRGDAAPSGGRRCAASPVRSDSFTSWPGREGDDPSRWSAPSSGCGDRHRSRSTRGGSISRRRSTRSAVERISSSACFSAAPVSSAAATWNESAVGLGGERRGCRARGRSARGGPGDSGRRHRRARCSARRAAVLSSRSSKASTMATR